MIMENLEMKGKWHAPNDSFFVGSCDDNGIDCEIYVTLSSLYLFWIEVKWGDMAGQKRQFNYAAGYPDGSLPAKACAMITDAYRAGRMTDYLLKEHKEPEQSLEIKPAQDMKKRMAPR